MNTLNVSSELTHASSSPTGSRRLSLANLVSAQLELKRTRDPSFRSSSKRTLDRSVNVSLTRSSNRSVKETADGRLVSTNDSETGGMSQAASGQLAMMFIKSSKDHIECQVGVSTLTFLARSIVNSCGLPLSRSSKRRAASRRPCGQLTTRRPVRIVTSSTG